jgi:gluconolactonase
MMRVIAGGLLFPEGPVVMNDGSIALVEMRRGTVSRVTREGTISVIAETGGGPNGLAIGPDRAFYVCNNGGFVWSDDLSVLMPTGLAPDYKSGHIDRVDSITGEVRVLYSGCGERPLSAPNDIVFDNLGGFYFTDLGHRHANFRDHGGIYYAQPDGSRIVEVAYPVLSPNGIGLSPDGGVLYFAETETGRIWAYDIIEPGRVKKLPFPHSINGGRIVCGLPGFQRFDSLAIDAMGNICVATLMTGCISVISPDGTLLRQVKMPDVYTTNICFGGAELKTAFITQSFLGQLIAVDWPEPGLRLAFEA